MTTRGAPDAGYCLDPAYPRAQVTDRDPPWNAKAAIDGPSVYSEFVAPWRYPDHNMAGMRTGWEAPRTHVGPYVQGDDVRVLMGGMPGSDAARRQFESATTPSETEAVSSALLARPARTWATRWTTGRTSSGWLTGIWQSATAYSARGLAAAAAGLQPGLGPGLRVPVLGLHCATRRACRRRGPLDRHGAAGPVALRAPDRDGSCRSSPGATEEELARRIRDLYGYKEPLNVPQRYEAEDNPHHRSRYDPLKQLAHHYLPRAGEPCR